MSHAFTRHAIDHLSVSSLNLWKEAPGIWALRYLKRMKDSGNADLWRGSAVENGAAALLRGVPLEDACALAHQAFDLNSQGESTDEIDVERELIAGMVGECQKWKPPSDLAATQLKVEYWFEDIPIPVIGYLDLAFESGIDIDLKTTKACPSAPRPDHVRQVSLYRAARNRQGGVLYVTTKRHAYYDIADEAMAQALLDLETDAHCLYQFLGRVQSADDALKILPINRDHFMMPKPHKTKVPLADVLLAG